MALVRVLHILEATGGGTARHVVDLCAGLAQRGVEVHLAYSPLRADRIFRDGLPRLSRSGVRLLEVPMRRSPHPSDLKALMVLRGYIRRFGPFALLHGHSSKGGALARLLRAHSLAKAVYTPHAFVTLSPSIRPPERWIYGLVERALSLLTDALIAVSEDEAREAGRLGFPKKTIRVIPNAIDLSLTPPRSLASFREEWGVGREDRVVGFVGRFAEQKNPLLLLEAFARITHRHPEARLVMVGDGPLKPLVLQKVEASGLREQVVLPGFLEGRAAMGAFDLLALSSDYEGFPYVLSEAIAAGLPVVATAVGGTEMAVMNGQNGFLVKPGDVEGFARALDRLLSDDVLRQRFAQRSLELAPRFSVGRMVEDTLALYHALLGDRHAGS